MVIFSLLAFLFVLLKKMKTINNNTNEIYFSVFFQIGNNEKNAIYFFRVLEG